MKFGKLKYSAAGEGVLIENPPDSAMQIIITDVKIAGESIYDAMRRDLEARGLLEIRDYLSLAPGEGLRCQEAVGETVIEWIEEPRAALEKTP